METKKYKTKTRIIGRRNIKVDGTWEIALDIGYSSVKLFSPNKIVSFPSYAKNVGTYIDWANGIPEDAIMYKENGFQKKEDAEHGAQRKKGLRCIFCVIHFYS